MSKPFFFQAEDGIRDRNVTGVQTCALPISLKNQDESIAETIKEVSDITSAKPAEFSDVNEWKTKAVKKAKEVDEDLDTFTGIGDEHDVESILSQIESVMEQAQTSKGS